MAADLMCCIYILQPWGGGGIRADRRVIFSLKDWTAWCKAAAVLGALEIKYTPSIFGIHIQSFDRLIAFFVNQ